MPGRPQIHRSNACALATLIRDAVKLWRNPGAADFAEQRVRMGGGRGRTGRAAGGLTEADGARTRGGWQEVITRACDHWHEHALECMVDAGLGKLERDYSHYLVGRGHTRAVRRT